MANATRTLTLTLSDADLTEAVIEWAARKRLLSGGDKTTTLAPVKLTVTVEVTKTTTGYGLAERDEHVGRVVLRGSADG